jgi:hypothetical protein
MTAPTRATVDSPNKSEQANIYSLGRCMARKKSVEMLHFPNFVSLRIQQTTEPSGSSQLMAPTDIPESASKLQFSSRRESSAASARRRRRRIIITSPTPNIPSIPGSGVETGVLYSARPEINLPFPPLPSPVQTRPSNRKKKDFENIPFFDCSPKSRCCYLHTLCNQARAFGLTQQRSNDRHGYGRGIFKLTGGK